MKKIATDGNFWFTDSLNFKGHDFEPIEDISTKCRTCGERVLLIWAIEEIPECKGKTE